MTTQRESNETPQCRLLTVAKAAEMLGCSRTNVYALINSGELAVVQVGKSRGYRIEHRDIDEFILRRKFSKDGETLSKLTRPKLTHIKL